MRHCKNINRIIRVSHLEFLYGFLWFRIFSTLTSLSVVPHCASCVNWRRRSFWNRWCQLSVPVWNIATVTYAATPSSPSTPFTGPSAARLFISLQKRFIRLYPFIHCLTFFCGLFVTVHVFLLNCNQFIFIASFSLLCSNSNLITVYTSKQSVAVSVSVFCRPGFYFHWLFFVSYSGILNI